MRSRWIRPPWHLLVAATLLSLAFAFAHLAGYREYVSFLSGTAPAGSWGMGSMACGAVYLLTYLMAIFVVPVLLLWAALGTGARALLAARRTRSRVPRL